MPTYYLYEWWNIRGLRRKMLRMLEPELCMIEAEINIGDLFMCRSLKGIMECSRKDDECIEITMIATNEGIDEESALGQKLKLIAPKTDLTDSEKEKAPLFLSCFGLRPIQLYNLAYFKEFKYSSLEYQVLLGDALMAAKKGSSKNENGS